MTLRQDERYLLNSFCIICLNFIQNKAENKLNKLHLLPSFLLFVCTTSKSDERANTRKKNSIFKQSAVPSRLKCNYRNNVGEQNWHLNVFQLVSDRLKLNALLHNIMDPENDCLHLNPQRSRWLLTPPLITLSDCCAIVSVWVPPTTTTVTGIQQVTSSHRIRIRLDQCDKPFFFPSQWRVLGDGPRRREGGQIKWTTE